MGFFICRIVRVFLWRRGWKIFILFMFSVLYISNGIMEIGIYVKYIDILNINFLN